MSKAPHPRQKKPLRTTVNSFRIAFVSGTLNGKTLRTVNYERTEFDDGSIEDKGRPKHIPADLPLTGQGGMIERLFEYANG